MFERLQVAMLTILAMAIILALFAVFVVGATEVVCGGAGCDIGDEPVERNYP